MALSFDLKGACVLSFRAYELLKLLSEITDWMLTVHISFFWSQKRTFVHWKRLNPHTGLFK